MTTYFGLDRTVVTLDKSDFTGKEQVKFGYGVDILLIPLKVSQKQLKLLEVELTTLKLRKGEVIFYSSKITK